MKQNADKCHLLLCGHKYGLMIENVDNNFIIESHKVKLLGIEIDSDLKFKDHINSICDTVSKKINALSRQCNVLPFTRRKHLMQAFFYSQFSHCPLVWMFCNQNQNTRINKLHHRALRVVYRDVVSPFEELLRKDGSVTIHHGNLHFLVTEIYKVKNGTTPSFMSDIFVRNNNANCISANTRSHSEFYNYINPTTTNCGIKTLRHLGPILWNMLPEIIKSATSVKLFKRKIKNWVPFPCPCWLCGNYA